jgi:hypothetical protein
MGGTLSGLIDLCNHAERSGRVTLNAGNHTKPGEPSEASDVFEPLGMDLLCSEPLTLASQWWLKFLGFCRFARILCMVGLLLTTTGILPFQIED